MPYIETYYDYDIHRECFRVSDTASYTRTTDTLLTLTDTVSEVINYYTAILSLDVIRNLGDGKVALYDNDDLLQLIDFNENTSKITNLNVQLNYNVEHNLEARFLGNDECLASKSSIVPVLMELPNEFYSEIRFLSVPSDGVILNPSTYMELDMVINDSEELPIPNATIKFYADDADPITVTTNNEGYYQFSSPTHFSSDFGIHTIKAVYETTSDHIGTETEITLYLGYLATLTPTQSKYIVGQTPTFEITTMGYDGSEIADTAVTLWRG